MNISEMNLEQVIARIAELDVIVRDATTAETIDEATEEKRQLLERKHELEELEARQAGAAALESGAAQGKTKEKREGEDMNEKEYRKAWLLHLMGRNEEVAEEYRAAVTGEAAVIPTETLNKMILRLQQNPLLSKIDMLQIPGYVKIPIYATNNAASWTTTSTDSQDAFDYIVLEPKQLIKTIEVPATINQMSIDAFESYVVSAMSNVVEAALEKAVLVGTGTNDPTGIVTTIATTTGTFTKAAVTKADLLKIMGSLPADYQNGACWIMPALVFYGEVMNIADHNTFASINAGFDIKLFGKDVVLSDEVNATALTNDNILYGNPKAYHMNLGEGVNVSKDASVGFRSNSVVYRGVCLADGKLDNAAAFVRYKRAN